MPVQESVEYNTNALQNLALNERLYEQELLRCEQAGADAKALREAGFNVFQLEQIRQGLEEGVDTSVYRDVHYSWLDMEEIRKGLKQGVDMTAYREAGFSTAQKREIRKGLARGLDVSQYARKEYFSDQMRQIRYGLQDKLPIVFYNNPQYSGQQMEEIRKGLLGNLDISAYANTDMPYLKMRAIRESMEDGLYFLDWEIEEYDEGILEQLHKAYLAGVDIMPYVKKEYNTPQLEQIRISLQEKLRFDPYIRKDMRGESLKEIRLGLEAGLDVKEYAKEEYRWRQMREIRLGLEKRLKVSYYSNPLFGYQQMREIRLGLEQGLDVKRYNSLVFTAYDMRQIRLSLMRGEVAGRRYYEPEEIPSVYNDPVIPYALRPDPRALRAAYERERDSLQARKQGRPSEFEDYGEEVYGIQTAPPVPQAKDVPVTLHTAPKGSEAPKEQPKPRREFPKIDMHGQTIVVTEDHMACYMALPRPVSGQVYTEELVRALLKRVGVVAGYDEAAIKEYLQNERFGQQFVAAIGEEPDNGQSGRYEYYFDRRNPTNPELNPDGSADYSHSRFYSEVQQGDVIASYTHAKGGRDGFTVTGEVLPARSGMERPLLKGRGFIVLEDKNTYAAAVSGVARTEGFELNINRLLSLTQDIIEVHQKIEFLGSIHVNCNVMPGTVIIAQGDVIMETIAESLTIKAGGDIVLKEGATGRTRGTIEAGGSVSGKYFNNCNITAKGSVFANSFLHCNIDTEEKIVCFGENGTAFGGRLTARLGLECAVVGSESGVPTDIVLGVTSKMIAQYGEANKVVERIVMELKTIAAEVEKVAQIPAQSKEVMQIKIKLNAAYASKRKEYEAAQKKVDEITDYINGVAGSETIISNILYAGTTLYVDEAEIKIADTKEASEEKPIVIKGKAKQWWKLQKKS